MLVKKISHSFEEDRRLLARCFAGDTSATEEFVLRFSDLVYRYVQQTLIIKNIRFTDSDIEDFHNTVFLSLFEKDCHRLKQYQGKNGCTLATWVRTVTVRIILNHIRKKGIDGIKERSRLLSLEDFFELTEEGQNAPERMECSEREQLIREGMKTLAPRERLLLKLHFDKELSLPDVADTLSVSIQNAYTIKHRALEKLKSYVKNKSP